MLRWPWVSRRRHVSLLKKYYELVALVRALMLENRSLRRQLDSKP